MLQTKDSADDLHPAHIVRCPNRSQQRRTKGGSAGISSCLHGALSSSAGMLELLRLLGCAFERCGTPSDDSRRAPYERQSLALFWRRYKPNAANIVGSESDDDRQKGAADGFAPHRSRTPEEDGLFFTPTPSAARAVANARFASRSLNFAYIATQIVVVQLGALADRTPRIRH